MRFKYSKKDKLKSKIQIENLFKNGDAVTAYPLKLVYLNTLFDDGSFLKTSVSVSKRLHKTAVARQRIKRLMREAYRLNKPLYFTNNTSSFSFMILYLSKEETTYHQMNKQMILLFEKFIKKQKRSQ